MTFYKLQNYIKSQNAGNAISGTLDFKPPDPPKLPWRLVAPTALRKQNNILSSHFELAYVTRPH